MSDIVGVSLVARAPHVVVGVVLVERHVERAGRHRPGAVDVLVVVLAGAWPRGVERGRRTHLVVKPQQLHTASTVGAHAR